MKTGTQIHEPAHDFDKVKGGWYRKGKRGGAIFDDPASFPFTCLALYEPAGWITVQKG